MTMIITMIRPEGVWQSADNRVTLKGKIINDITPKLLHIVCPPFSNGPQILMAFTGLAELPDGTPMLQYIRETIRGENRAIVPMVEHLCSRLTRDVGRSIYWRHMLILSCGIFEGDKRFYLEIRNRDANTRVSKRTFEYSAAEITEPTFFIGGSGRDRIAPEDIELLRRQSKIRPAHWQDHLGLLAGVNRRTAKKVRSVSPWCQTAFLSSETHGAEMRRFTRPGEPPVPEGIEMIFGGVDFLELSRDMTRRVQSIGAGGESGAAAKAETQQAGRRATEGRP